MTLHPASSIPFETRTITGWGRTSPVVARVLRPDSVEPLQDFIREAPPQSSSPEDWVAHMAMLPNYEMQPLLICQPSTALCWIPTMQR